MMGYVDWPVLSHVAPHLKERHFCENEIRLGLYRACLPLLIQHKIRIHSCFASLPGEFTMAIYLKLDFVAFESLSALVAHSQAFETIAVLTSLSSSFQLAPVNTIRPRANEMPAQCSASAQTRTFTLDLRPFTTSFPEVVEAFRNVFPSEVPYA
jgi:hypothetical protein